MFFPSGKEHIGRHQFLNWCQQISTVYLHVNGFDSLQISKRKWTPLWCPFSLEQDTGVEPAFTAWEAVVLPIYESCVCVGIIAERFGKFNH